MVDDDLNLLFLPLFENICMNQGKMTFSQIIECASSDVFRRCVDKYNGNYRARDFSCWKQFLCMCFGQLTHRESMSDTMLCLKLNRSKLYHLGIGKPFDKSTLSRANESRNWKIYQDFGLKLIEQAKELYKSDNQLDVKLKGEVYALDSTTVDLCLDVFCWATFRPTKAAIKIHTLLDLKTSIPDYIFISEGNVHDINALDKITIQKGSYYVMDKAYGDFARLYHIKLEKAYFVIRPKDNLRFKRILSRSADKRKGILCDQDILLKSFYPRKKYPLKIRRIRFYDKENKQYFTFLTNNYKLKATSVAQLYKYRWYVEIFFKWIKQHLKIKSFWGNSENAVRTQIWIAISTYILVAIAKKKFKIDRSLYEMLQYISLSPFERISIYDAFKNTKYQDFKELRYNQLNIF